MKNIVYNLAQVPVTVFFIFFDHSSIDSSSWDIEGQVFLTSVQMRIFLSRAQVLADLIGLIKLATITTIIINSRGVESFFNLKVFLILGISFYQPITMRITNITFLYQEKSLTIYINLNIYTSLNSLLPIGYILVYFIQLGLDQGLLIISEISYEEVIQGNSNDIKFF